MRYKVFRTHGPYEKYEVFVVEARNFIIKKNHIIFKNGFRAVSLFQSDLVDYILKEDDSND